MRNENHRMEVVSNETLRNIYLEHQSAVLLENGTILCSSWDSAAIEPIYSALQQDFHSLGFEVVPERKVDLADKKVISARLKALSDRKSGQTENIANPSDRAKIAKRMLQEAVNKQVSDIHIDLYKAHTRIEFRVDGRLIQFGKVIEAYDYGKYLIGYLFNEAPIKDRDFNISVPNSGRLEIEANFGEKKRNTLWRISYIPAKDKGGQCVLRWLNKDEKLPTVDELGWEPGQLREARQFMRSKAGVCIMAGQTGGGKSTSIAAMISEVRRKGRSINTLEDPVEFDLEVIQTSVMKDDNNAHFAEYNKLLKRHDVDICLLGETREKASAMEVCRNGEAGMLMLTSLHTSSALGVAPTLIEQLHIAPSLVSAPNLMKIWMYQTLVRRLCPKCSITLEEARKVLSSEQLLLFNKWVETHHGIDTTKLRFRSVKGCNHCTQGEKGRTALLEMIVLDDEDREFILKRDYLGWEQALKTKGFKSVIDHANLKIKRGDIDLFTAAERVDGIFPRDIKTVYSQMWEEE